MLLAFATIMSKGTSQRVKALWLWALVLDEWEACIKVEGCMPLAFSATLVSGYPGEPVKG